MKRNTINTVLLLGLLSLAIVGCKDDKQILATVNGREISQEQFDAYLELKRIPAKDEKRREAAWEDYVQREALAAIIESEGKLETETVAAEVNEFRKQMLISRYFDEFLGEQVSSEAVQNKYKADTRKFETQKVHVAHILVRTNKRMSETQRQAKFTTAQEVYSKLQSGGDFAALAREFSEDKISGSRGGDLGWIKEGTIDARFSKRAFSMKAGKTTEPFETPFGYHILKVLEAPKTIRRPLGAVAGEIRYQLRNETKEAEMKRLEELVSVVKKKPYALDEAKKIGEAKPRQDAALSGAGSADLKAQAGAKPNASPKGKGPAAPKRAAPAPGATKPLTPPSKPAAPKPAAGAAPAKPAAVSPPASAKGVSGAAKPPAAASPSATTPAPTPEEKAGAASP